MEPIYTTGNVTYRGSFFCRRFLSAAIMAAGQALFMGSAQAGPEGGKVVGGQGSISQDERITTVNQGSDRLAVDWDSFDVDVDEIVNYIQPGSDAIALNRILSHNGSEIHGQISANGQVFLVSPNGIVFGENARINAGGVLASGLDIGTDEFMNGDYTFSALEDTQGKVVNRGLIQAAKGGSVGLIGQQVNNEGVISAQLGAVNLAAGKEAVVTFDGEGLMGVRISKEIMQDELGVDPALMNSGDLEAQGGRILLTASASRDIFSQAVNTGDMAQASDVEVHEDGSFTLGGGADLVNTGSLDVSSEAESAGQVALLGENVTHSGQIDANTSSGDQAGQVELQAGYTNLITEQAGVSALHQSGVGGDIALLGERVGLADQAAINASGAAGGGEILVGGDYKGGNEAVRNSLRTFVGPEAQLLANSTGQGDGGRIIVWADEVTRYAGHLEAKGAGQGRGGFAEVSGKEVLDFDGTASLSGPGGAGVLLLDPRDITIGQSLNADDDPPEEGVVEFDDLFGDPPEEDVTFSSDDIVDILDGDPNDANENGTNVILRATRDIEVTRELETDGNNTNSLTLEAGDDILVGLNAHVDLGAGNIDFFAGVNDCGDATCSEAQEDVTEDVLGGRSIDIAGKLDTTGTINLRAADNISVDAAIGDAGSLSSVTLRAGNKINVSANITTAVSDENKIGEEDNTAITLKAGDEGLSDLTSSSLADDGHEQHLIIDGELESQGGNIKLNARDAVDVNANISTLGGHLIVGNESENSGGYRPTSFDSQGQTLTTGTSGLSGDRGRHAGKVRLYTQIKTDDDGNAIDYGAGDYENSGNVNLGEFDLDVNYEELNQVSDGEGVGALSVGSIFVSSAGDITLHEEWNFNNTGPYSYNGDGGYDGNGEKLGAAALELVADGSITLEGRIYDEFGDARESLDITLKADNDNNESGDITISENIFTSGGDFSADGVNLTLPGRIDTRHANLNGEDDTEGLGGDWTEDGLDETQGWSTGGDITLEADSDITLSNLVTIDSCIETATCTGGLTITLGDGAEELTQQFVAEGSEDNALLDVAGTTTLDIGDASAALTNENNVFGGDWTITSAGDVDIHQNGDITLNVANGVGTLSVDTSGRNEDGFRDAGSITIGSLEDQTLTEVTLGSVQASGYDHNNEDQEGNRGDIDITAGKIVLTGDVASIGRPYAPDQDAPDTLPGIGFNGAVDLAQDVMVNESGAPLGELGNIIFSGELTEQDGASNPVLTLYGSNVTFGGAVGDAGGDNLFGLSIHSYGDVRFQGNTAPQADSIQLAGLSDDDQTLSLTDTDNQWHLRGGTDFGDENSDASTSYIAFDNSSNEDLLFHGFDTLRGGSGADYFKVEYHGAAYVLDGGTGTGTNTLTAYNDPDHTNLWSVSESEAHSLDSDADSSATDIEFVNIATLNGSGEDRLTGPDGANAWKVESAGGGTLEELVEQRDPGYSVSFSGMDTLKGGSEQDIFTLNPDVSLASINGGGTGNTLEVISSQDDNIAWTLTEKGSGSVDQKDSNGDVINEIVVDFSNISNLLGGSGNDTFDADHNDGYQGVIDGGSGTNEVDFTDLDANATLEIGVGDTESVWDFKNILSLTGSGDDSTLSIAHGNNTWTIDEDNGGTIKHDVDDLGGLEPLFSGDLEFSGFGNLKGGSNTDTFSLEEGFQVTGDVIGGDGDDAFTLKTAANVGGTVDGGGGDNTLEILGDGTGSLTWEVTGENAGDADDRIGDFENIANLTGSGDNDTFILKDGGRLGGTIDGAGGDNTLEILGDGNGSLTWSVTGEDAGDGGQRVEEFKNVANLTGSGDDDTFSLEDGGSISGMVDGVGGDNTLEVKGDGNGSLTWSVTEEDAGDAGQRVEEFKNIANLTGSGDDDTFSLENDSAHISGMVTGGGGRNTLEAKSSGNTWTLNSAYTGRLKHSSGSSDFSEIQKLVGSGNDTLKAAINTRPNRWQKRDGEWRLEHLDEPNDTLTFSGMAHWEGGGNADVFHLGGSSDIDSVSGGGGNNSLFASGDHDWTLTAAPAAGDPGWTLTAAPSGHPGDETTFSYIHSITGSDGTHTLNGVNQDNEWRLTDALDGTVQLDGSEDTDQLAFSGMDVLVGQGGDDDFTVASGDNHTGNLKGGGGSDTLIVKGGTNTWELDQNSVFDGGVGSRVDSYNSIETLIGSGGDTLAGPSHSNDWDLTGDGDRTLTSTIDGSDQTITFNGMATLQGGTATDDFTVASGANHSGSLKGGGGSDTLTVSGGTNTWALDDDSVVDGGVGSRVDEYSSIETVTGSGGDTLIGTDQTNGWKLTGDGDGTLTSDGDELSFNAMETLQGTDATDNFTIASDVDYGGTLLGQGGADTLTVSGGTNTWELDQNSVFDGGVGSRVDSYNSIETLIGSGGDTLVGPNQSNLWHLKSNGNWTLSENVNNPAESLSFSEMAVLEGSSGKDEFLISYDAIPSVEVIGTSNQGNTLKVNGDIDEITWNLDTLTSGNIDNDLEFSQIQNFDLSGYHGEAGLTGLDEETKWLIEDEGEGRFGPLGDKPSTYTGFSGFTQLNGGNERDDFVLQDGGLTFTLDGGDGNNRLYAYSRANDWKLSDSVNTLNENISFSNMDHLVGNILSDSFVIGQGQSVATVRGAPEDETEADGVVNSLQVHSSGNSESALEWIVSGDGSGNVDGRVGNFYNMADLTGGAGDDTFTIQDDGYIGGTIGGGEGTNTLSAQAANNTWSLNDPFVGSIKTSVGNITGFEAIQTLQGSGSDTLMADKGQNNRWQKREGQWRLEQAVDNPGDTLSFSGMAHWVGGAGKDLFHLGEASGIDSVNGSGGSNSLLASGDRNWVLTGVASGELDGETTFSDIQSITGSEGDHTLTGVSQDNEWRLTGDSTGTVQLADSADDQRLAFAGMDTLVGQGGDDAFTQLSGAEADFAGKIRGGEGANSLSAGGANDWSLSGVHAGSLNDMAFSAIQVLSGGGDDNQLTGPDEQAVWTLTGKRAGTLAVGAESVTFSGMESLTGGSKKDTFGVQPELTRAELASFSRVDGAGGEKDSLDLTGLNNQSSVTLALMEHDQAHLVALNLEELKAHRADGNTLIGPESDARGYRWRIDDQNEGALAPDAQNSPESSLSFSGFSNLTGGDQSDVFALVDSGSVSGTIDGGGGINLLDQSESNGEVNVILGQSISGDGLNILNISGVVGKHDGSEDTEGSSTLIIADDSSTNTWTIEQQSDVASSDGVNDGYVQSNNGDSLYFIDFNHLVGGGGSDLFQLENNGRLVGTLEGRGGANVVDATDSTRALSFGLRQTSLADTYLRDIGRLSTNADHTNTLVGAHERNQWLVNRATGNGTLNEDFVFSGLSELVGGSKRDRFVLSGEGAVDQIDGGGQPADEVDRVDISQVDSSRRVTLDEQAESGLVVTGVEDIVAASGAGHELQADRGGNRWRVDGPDTGTLNGEIAFSGFDHLLGNEGTDTFELHGDASVTGSLDGAGGDDTLDLIQLDSRSLALALADRDGADLVLYSMESINAPTRAGHTLMGAHEPNEWEIDGVNQGSVGETGFTGVASLVGGRRDDYFEYRPGGRLEGILDGGEHQQGDTLDVSALAQANIELGESGTVARVEQIVGNGQSTHLYGPDRENTWRLNQGDNAGSLNGRIEFAGVTDLTGGDKVDTFYMNGGQVTGGLSGGEGDDRFELTLASGADGELSLLGGPGDDRMLITGGAPDNRVDYAAAGQNEENLTYRGADSAVFELTYGEVDRVEALSTAEHLSLGGTSGADGLTLGDGAYQVDGMSELLYENKTDLTIAADGEDNLAIAGPVNVPGELTLREAGIEQTNDDGLLSAESLIVTGVESVGSSDQFVQTSVDTLSIADSDGEVFLQDEGAVNLARVQNSGRTEVRAAGEIRSEGDLAATGDLGLESRNAGIHLGGDNTFDGLLSLSAEEAIVVNSTGATTLGEVNAAEFTYTGEASLDGADPIRVDQVNLDVDGAVTLDDENNHISRLDVDGAEHLTLASDSRLDVRRLNSDGDIVLRTAGLSLSAPVAARSLELQAGGSPVDLESAINLEQDLLVRSGRLNTSRNISARSIDIEATGDVEQGADIIASQGLSMASDENIDMSEGALAQTDTGELRYAAGGDLTLGRLVNEQGRVRLHSGRRINSAGEGDTDNIRAERLTIESEAGVGDSQRLRTRISELHLTNNEGQVRLTNSGELVVTRLANNGDIALANLSGDVVLDGREGPVFNPEDADARSAGGTVNGNYSLGSLTMTLDEGNLLAEGEVDGQQPDLVARSGTLVVNGSIGEAGRPLAMHFRDSLFIQGVRSWPPVWSYGRRPDDLENNSATQISQEDLMRAGGEQLVEVESLEEIDPAIFTEVRNYSYDDVSILMPPDQRYEDADEERYSRQSTQ